MAKKKIDPSMLTRSFQGESRQVSNILSDIGKPELIDFNLIKKNPLNTGNDKTEEVIESLMISIDTIGLLECPIVYKDDDNFYTLISGEGRWTAISRLKEKKQCFEKILCIVRPKPKNEDEEKLLILSANEQRNPYSIERSRKNIRELCQHAKNLSDQGFGDFDELIRGMSVLKRSSVYNYVKINEDLLPELIELFDQDKLSLRDANVLARYNQTEQRILIKHFFKDDKIVINKSSIKSILEETKSADKETFKKVDAAYEEIKEKDKEIKKLQSELASIHEKNKALEQRILSVYSQSSTNEEEEHEAEKAVKQLKRGKKKTLDKERALQQTQEELEIVKEKLKKAEMMIPSLSEEDIKQIKEKQEIIQILESMKTSSDSLNKKLTSYQKKYGKIESEIIEHISLVHSSMETFHNK